MELLMQKPEIIVQHGAWNTNGVADLLAKTCRKLDFSNYATVILNQAPNYIEHVILEENLPEPFSDVTLIFDLR